MTKLKKVDGKWVEERERFTLIAATDERHPTYLYIEINSGNYILTAQISLGGMWVSKERAQEFVDREDTDVVANSWRKDTLSYKGKQNEN